MQAGDNVLITTDAWFIAPDGGEYRAVWGTVKGVKSAEETLGIKTNARSTNWYIEIGDMVVAGCQIHYAIKSDDPPNTGTAKIEAYHEGKPIVSRCISRIYNANGSDQA